MTTVRLTAAPGEMPRCTNAETGEPIQGIAGATIHLPARGTPHIILAVHHGAVDITSPHVSWTGLEKVPTEALAAELARREDGALRAGLAIPPSGA